MTGPLVGRLELRSSICERANQFFGAVAKFPKAAISYITYVCPSHRPPAWNNWARTGRVFMKFNISVFLENLKKNLKNFVKI
jgi:hypothetical protein